MKILTIGVHLFSFLILIPLAVLPSQVLSRKELQPVLSLKHLEGCRKGQTVKGLHEIKQYLKRFGYANVVDDINNNRLEHENDDTFDDVLESEIKAYQLNHNLDVTGELDTRTLEQMMLPRCGVPDIDKNGKSSMKWNHYHRGDESPNFKLFGKGYKWPPSKYNLTYKFTHTGTAPTKIDKQTLRDVCARSFAKWAVRTYSPFRFKEAGEGEHADIVIGFHRWVHGDGKPFDGPLKTYAHAFAPRDGRLHLDADENWGTGPASNEVDLESIVTHEIGHILGLLHTSDGRAVMFPTLGRGATRREIGADDILGIVALYPFGV
ncbi:hypothetical protein MKW94_027129 [Papaver nudicaule]|uniref:Peptidase metallopeptidase domain-containing protein n=1 Tax=Papaver nudicaule TaxID=74823 RepID=A0AA41RWK7_PAPNU|nr:hypothetical protein [Papaver nudicaule]